MMRHLQQLSLLLLFGTCFFSCSKSDSPVNRSDQLKNTVWAGQFNYSAGAYMGLQPFSITLSGDGTLTWSDLGSTRPGGTWKVNNDQVTITFPNSTTLSATVSNNSWSNFVSGTSAGVTVQELIRSAVPTQTSLTNTNWVGNIGSGTVFKLKFIDAGKLEFMQGAASAISATYTVEGAGIRFSYTGILSNDQYFAVLLNQTMRGIEAYTGGSVPFKTSYYTWITNKQ